MTRVLIADPDPNSRNALFLWLVYKIGIDEIILVEDGESLLKQLEQEIPNVVLMDWSLPGRPAPECLREIQKINPGLQWIILSVDAEVSEQALNYSKWFLQKGSPPQELFLLLQETLG